MKLRLLLLCLSALAIFSCEADRHEQENEPVTISFWHFWSEPLQQEALLALIQDFESTHPGIKVELTPLSWADGKAKIHMAYNSATQPDVLHIGLDWFAEFHEADVFAPLSVKGAYHSHAAMWTVNARALVEWTGAPAKYEWGLCVSDAHNVVKRTLPLIWSSGAPDFLTTLPVSDHMGSELADALWSIRSTKVDRAVLDRSRVLDERFLRGEIHYLYTGAWIVDMATSQGVSEFRVVPGRSVLNGDLLCVSASTNRVDAASEFVAWITASQQTRQFCDMVSDAGFPYDTAPRSDERYVSDSIRVGFFETARMASPLPISPRMLAIEPIVEELIERSYEATSKNEIEELVKEAKRRVLAIS